MQDNLKYFESSKLKSPFSFEKFGKYPAPHSNVNEFEYLKYHPMLMLLQYQRSMIYQILTVSRIGVRLLVEPHRLDLWDFCVLIPIT